MERDFDKVGIAVFNVNNGLKFEMTDKKELVSYKSPKKDWGNVLLYFLLYICLFGIFYLVQFL